MCVMGDLLGGVLFIVKSSYSLFNPSILLLYLGPTPSSSLFCSLSNCLFLSQTSTPSLLISLPPSLSFPHLPHNPSLSLSPLCRCLMLDFDSDGEGAADLQVHTGKIRVSVGAGILACLEDSVTKENAKRYVQYARYP
jgi:hypothetical protein